MSQYDADKHLKQIEAKLTAAKQEVVKYFALTKLASDKVKAAEREKNYWLKQYKRE